MTVKALLNFSPMHLWHIMRCWLTFHNIKEFKILISPHVFMTLNALLIGFPLFIIYAWFTLLGSHSFKSHPIHRSMANNDIQVLLSYHALTGLGFAIFFGTCCNVNHVIVILTFLFMSYVPLFMSFVLLYNMHDT